MMNYSFLKIQIIFVSSIWDHQIIPNADFNIISCRLNDIPLPKIEFVLKYDLF